MFSYLISFGPSPVVKLTHRRCPCAFLSLAAVSIVEEAGYTARRRTFDILLGRLAAAVLQLGNQRLDLCPLVLKGLGSAAGHVDFVPLYALSALLKLGDDSEEELKLQSQG